MSHIDLIVKTAQKYIGQEEIQPNLGFKDPLFQQKMNAVGFYRSASWCGFFVILVLKEVYSDAPEIWKYLKKYLSPSTHETWVKCKASKEIATGQTPKIGAIAIWQEGDTGNGHMELVISVASDSKHFSSDGGNTAKNGSRNGYIVGENSHVIGLPHSEKGLNLSGFCYMPA